MNMLKWYPFYFIADYMIKIFDYAFWLILIDHIAYICNLIIHIMNYP